MNNKRNTKERVEEILSSLDASQRASAPDFFYTRLNARMENGLEVSPRKTSWTLRPVYALAALALLFVLNGAILLQGGEKTEATAENSINEPETAQSIAAEYSLNDNSTIYELNPEK